MKIRKYEIYDITWKTIIWYSWEEDDDFVIKMIMKKSPFPLDLNKNVNNDEIIMIIPDNIISISVKEI